MIFCKRQKVDNRGRVICSATLYEGHEWCCPYTDPQKRAEAKKPCAEFYPVDEPIKQQERMLNCYE